MVNIKLRVLWRPVIEKLPQLYRELGTDFDEVSTSLICWHALHYR
jgi:hypothetical protein